MERFSRQLIFERIGVDKQKLISQSRVVIVGVGGLGTHSAELMARAGVKELILIDRDIVDLSNLQRQTLFDESDVGNLKVEAAYSKLKKINSKLKIRKYFLDLNHENVNILKGDLVLDCTDNFETRFLINDHCRKNKIPWIFSSVIGSTGMCYVIKGKKPCFQCIFKDPSARLGTCSTEGIVNTIVPVISGFQVTEAIKILTKQIATKEMVHFDVWKQKLTKVKVSKKVSCSCCKGKYNYLSGDKTKEVTRLCGEGKYTIKGKKMSFLELKNKFDSGEITKSYFRFGNFMVFEDGRVIIKAKTKERAKSLYDKYFG